MTRLRNCGRVTGSSPVLTSKLCFIIFKQKMKLATIFAVQNAGIYALWYTGEEEDEWNRTWNNWNDVEWLEAFFEEHKHLLNSDFYKGVTVEAAVRKTIDDANQFEDKLLALFDNAKEGKRPDLDKKFVMLHKNDWNYELVQHKAYGVLDKTWLRIYAIKIAPNVYVVTGGAIKLTKAMHETKHTEKELIKLRNAVYYLQQENLISAEGIIEYFELE